jgi:hypothetical protein
VSPHAERAGAGKTEKLHDRILHGGGCLHPPLIDSRTSSGFVCRPTFSHSRGSPVDRQARWLLHFPKPGRPARSAPEDSIRGPPVASCKGTVARRLRCASGSDCLHLFGSQSLSADRPVAACELVDLHPGDASHALALHGGHRFGHLLDQLLLLARRENVTDDVNIDEWSIPRIPGSSFDRGEPLGAAHSADALAAVAAGPRNLVSTETSLRKV